MYATCTHTVTRGGSGTQERRAHNALSPPTKPPIPIEFNVRRAAWTAWATHSLCLGAALPPRRPRHAASALRANGQGPPPLWTPCPTHWATAPPAVRL